MGLARRPRALLAVLMAVAFLLDAVFFTGFFGSDDASYAWAAHLLAHGNQIDLGELAHVRLAINLPNAIVYWFANGNIAWLAWAHIGYHLALVALAYVIGRMIHGRNVGLVAAAIVAVNPLFFIYAGAILPDNPTAVWLAVTIVFLELGRRQALSPLKIAAPPYFAAGLAIGLAYSCKETGLIMTIPAAVCAIAATRGIRNWTWLRNGCVMAAGLAAFFVLELIALRITGGEWTLRLTLVSGADEVYHQKMSWQGIHPLERLDFAVSRRLGPFVPLTMWLLPIGAALYTFIRQCSLALITFFWWPAIFLTVGSTSLTSYTAPSIQTRYYAIVVLPAAVMVAALSVRLVDWFGRWNRRPPRLRSRYLAVGLVAIASLVAIKEVRQNLPDAGNIYGSHRARALALAIEAARQDYPHYPIVLSPFYATRLAPMFFPRAPDDIYADRRISHAGVPSPPFVYLSATDKSNGGGLENLRVVGVELEDPQLIFGTRRRIDLLRNDWRRLFGVRASAPYVRNREGAVLMQVVRKRVGERTDHDEIIAAPLLRLDRRSQIQPSRGGFFVLSKSASYSAQFFDERSYKRAPTFSTSHLSRPTRRTELAVSIAMLEGPGGEARVTVYGYNKGLVATNQTTSVVGPTPVELRVVLESEAEMTRIKIRVSIKAKAAVRTVTRIEAPLRIGEGTRRGPRAPVDDEPTIAEPPPLNPPLDPPSPAPANQPVDRP